MMKHSHSINRSKRVKPVNPMYNYQQSFDMGIGTEINNYGCEQMFMRNAYLSFDDVDIMQRGSMSYHGNGRLNITKDYLSVHDIDIPQKGLTAKQKESFMGIELELPPYIFQRIFEEEGEEKREDKTKLAEYFGEFMKFENYDRFINLVSISRSYEEIINSHVQMGLYFQRPEEWSEQFAQSSYLENQLYHKETRMLPEIKKYYDDEYDMRINYDMINEMNANNIIRGVCQKLLDVFVETYSDDAKIMKQFALDFPRNTVYVNNQLVESMDRFTEVLSPFNREYVIYDENGYRKRVTNIIVFAMSFVCQSSFYPAFIHLYNKLQKMKESKEALNNIHLTDTKERNVIEINITEDKIQCALIACFKLIDIRSDENVLYNIRSETLFDSDMDDYLIVYKSYK